MPPAVLFSTWSRYRTFIDLYGFVWKVHKFLSLGSLDILGVWLQSSLGICTTESNEEILKLAAK